MQSLLNKKCVPCEGGMPPLMAEEIEKYLPEVTGWELLEDKKIPLADFDLFIAATALNNNLTLITRNIKHFKRITNLKLYS